MDQDFTWFNGSKTQAKEDEIKSKFMTPVHVYLEPGRASSAHWVKDVRSEDEQENDEKNEVKAAHFDKIESQITKDIVTRIINNNETIGRLRGFHIHFLPRLEKFQDAFESSSNDEDGSFIARFSDYYMLPEEIWEKPLTDSNGFYSRWDPVLSSEIYGSLLQPLNTRGPLAKMPETFPERPTTAGSPQSPLEDVLYSEESSDISHGPITAVEAVQDSTIDSNSSESPASHWTMCRFLIKKYTPGHYNWSYITICSFWSKQLEANTHVYLCFGVPGEYRRAIVKRCRHAGDELIHGCPFVGYGMIMQSVVDFYNKSLWGLRDAVRETEKAREARLAPKSDGKTPSDPDYPNMAELTRHVIHAQETLGAANNTIQLMIKDHADRCPLGRKGRCVDYAKQNGYKPTHPLRQTRRSLTFHSSVLSNLKLRADSFQKRLLNEIRLAFNLASLADSQTLRGILNESAQDARNTFQLLQESRKDERELTTVVSLLTLVFLPGTFISGFFGMNFFTFEGDSRSWKTSPYIWVFFACSLPTTLIAIALWLAYGNLGTDNTLINKIQELLRVLLRVERSSSHGGRMHAMDAPGPQLRTQSDCSEQASSDSAALDVEGRPAVIPLYNMNFSRDDARHR